ncbi:DUF2726 domain-containing protein [Chromohalobacter japonicus]|uniref:DUF2726 domain-containing protein n=1 Tax=Chromohalobacter japonicus TaxID=223900 RepID=UPI001FF45814|nr:DUF2726 domain-containing protein [Chromohalobacter japonicus]MCK0753544.1 DUF2726 domain-containing protein [Chromohalobacter japonicus]
MEILFYLVLAVAVIAYLRSKLRRTPTSRRPPVDQTPWPTQQESPPTTPDPLAWQKDQLSQAALASYRPRRLMNREEHQVFQATERAARAMQAGHRVFAQVSLGEVLSTEDDDAYRAINSKRVDVLVTDRYGNPVAAVEYQGSGHNLSSDTGLRDGIKKIALEKAEIHYIEVHPPLDCQALSSYLLNRLQGRGSTSSNAASQPWQGQSSQPRPKSNS